MIQRAIEKDLKKFSKEFKGTKIFKNEIISV